MNIELKYQPSYTLGIVTLGPSEEIQVEGGSMVSMSPDVAIETKARGGLLKSLGRAMLGGESFFRTPSAPAHKAERSRLPRHCRAICTSFN